jgi:predicted dehydrogenase
MNLACYGAGQGAEAYLGALARRPDVSLAAVADNDQRAAERLAAAWGAPTFSEMETLLEEVRPDALLICVEPSLQDRAVTLAVANRLPFLVEPPGSIDYHAALRLRREIETAGLVNAVGFWPRFADVVQEAMAYVGAHPVPLTLGWWLTGQNTDAAITANEILVTKACVMLDAMCRFCGSVTQVRALTPGVGDRRNGIICELAFESGTTGILTCACFSRPMPRQDLELMGADWHLTFRRGFSRLEVVEQNKTILLCCQNNPFESLLTDFLASAASGQATGSGADYGDAVRILAIGHAVRESAQTGQSVNLADLEQAEHRD